MLAAVDGIVGETDAVLRLVLTADHGTVLILVVKKSSQTVTPSTRAILMRGASDGRSMLFSIRSICSIASPERCASSSILMDWLSRSDFIFSPTILLVSIMIVFSV